MHEDPDGPYRERSKAGQRRPKEATIGRRGPVRFTTPASTVFCITVHRSRITVVSDRQFGHHP